jgi:hypothetical protein
MSEEQEIKQDHERKAQDASTRRRCVVPLPPSLDNPSDKSDAEWGVIGSPQQLVIEIAAALR